MKFACQSIETYQDLHLQCVEVMKYPLTEYVYHKIILFQNAEKTNTYICHWIWL